MSLFGDIIETAVGVALIATGNVALGLALLSDVYGRDQRRKAEARAKQKFNDSLKDRYQMVKSGIESRRTVYGRARVSGPIVYAQSTGTKKEFLHLVIALAGHECDAIEGIYFNDILLPAEDGAGLVQSGEYCKTVTNTTSESFGSTSFSVAHTPLSVESVTRIVITGSGLDTLTASTVLVLGVGYTRAGAAITIIDGGGFGDGIYVNYTWQAITPRVRIKKFLGTSTQAASSDLITDSGGKWTSAHQLKGVCYVYVRLEFDQDIFGQSGLPNISALVRGKKVYDPRLDSTVAGGSGAHRVATPSTWAWSENAALCTGDYLREVTYGLGAPAAQVPALEVFTAAAICDQAVLLYNTGTVTVTNASPNVTGSGTSWLARVRPGMNFVGPNAVSMTVLSVTSNTALVLTANYGGSTLAGQAYAINEARYTCNGVLDSADTARNNLDKLVESMVGTVVWTQGRWLLRAGAHLSSSLTITEDLLGDKPPSIRPRSPRQDLFNRVVPQYVEREKLYTDMQAPSVTNATYVADDGGLDLPVEMVYDMVTGGVRAQRLAKIHLERGRQALTVTLSCNLKAYDLSPSDVVALTLTRYGWSAKLFEVVQRTLDMSTWQVELTLRETASGVWDWALGAETAIDLTPNTDLPNPFTAPAALTSLAADSSFANALRIGTSAVTPRAKVTWTQSTEIFVTQGGKVELQFKADTEADWQQVQSVPGDSVSAFIAPIQGDRVFLIRVRPVNSRGRFGPWTTIMHTTATQFDPGTIGGSNLLPNSSFEQDSNLDGLADTWLAYSAGSAGTLTRTTPTGGVSGGKYQSISSTALGISIGADRAGVYCPYASLDLTGLGGRSFVASLWFSASAQIDVVVQIEWVNSSNAAVGNSTQTFPSTVSAPFARAAFTATAPATAVKANFYVWMQAQSGRSVSAATLGIDNLQLELGDLLTAYSPRADELLPSQFGGVSLGGGNVISNASFDSDKNADGLADSWAAYSNGTVGTITRSVPTTGGFNNGRTQRLSATNLGTSSSDRVGVSQVGVRVDGWASQQFVLSAYIKADASGLPKFNLWIDWRDGGGTLMGTTNLGTSTPTTALARYSYTNTVPAGSVSADVYVWMESRPSAAGASAIEFDGVQLELGSVLGGFAPKVSEILQLNATTGQALNFDPNTSDEAEWQTGTHPIIATGIASGITGSTALHSATNGVDEHVYSPFARSIPVDRQKAYRISALIRKGGAAPLGTATAYLGIMGWNSSGADQRGVGSPAVPYTAYPVLVSALTTSFVRHTVTISQATIAAMQAGVVFIGPHCILGYTGASTLNGWVEMQDVRLEEVAATETIDANAAAEVVTVTAAGPVDCRTTMTTVATANFGPYPVATQVEVTFAAQVEVKEDPDFVGPFIVGYRAFIDGSAGTDSAEVGQDFGASTATNKGQVACSHTFTLPANTSGSAIGKVQCNVGETAPAPPGVGNVTNAIIRATIVKR